MGWGDRPWLDYFWDIERVTNLGYAVFTAQYACQSTALSREPWALFNQWSDARAQASEFAAHSQGGLIQDTSSMC